MLTPRAVAFLVCAWTLHAAGQSSHWYFQRPTPTGNTLRDVKHLGATSPIVVAVGDKGTLLRSGDDGATWVLGPPCTSANLNALSLVPALAVGSAGTIVRINAVGTTPTCTVVTSPTTTTLRALDWADLQNGWAVGDNGTVLRTTNGGTSWTVLASPGPEDLLAIRVTSLTTAYVLRAPSSPTGDQQVLYTSNGGSTWTPRATGKPGVTFYASFNYQNPSWAQFAGTGGTMIFSTSTGTLWSTVPTGTTRDLYAMAGANLAASGVAGRVVGASNATAPHEMCRNQSGPAGPWVPEAPPGPDGLAAYGISAMQTGTVPGPDFRAVVVGMGGLIERRETVTPPLGWELASVGAGAETLNAISASGSNLVAVGTAGKILTNTGTGWVNRTPCTTQTLNDVSVLGTTGFAAGNNGVICSSVGLTSWSQVYAGPATEDFLAVATATSNIAVAVGVGGIIRRTANAGTTWTPVVSGTTEDLRAIWTNGAAVYVAGDNGTLLVSTNSGVSFSPRGTATANFHSIARGSALMLALANNTGPIRTTRVYKSLDLGLTWTSSALGCLMDEVVMVDDLHAWVAGPCGLQHTRDGAQTWQAQSHPSALGLSGLAATSPALAWATGLRNTVLATRCGGSDVASCDDHNVCTTDTCDPSTGVCSHVSVPNGTTCSDNSACTVNDACQSGTCTGQPLTCNDQETCTTDSCNPLSGCVFTPLANGSGCNDGNSCTTPDTCTAGICGGPGVNCNDNNPCTIDSCNASVCSHTFAPNGTVCTDNSVCTTGDACQGGLCTGAALGCDDGNPCTADTCDSVAGCLHTALTGPVCDDGNACTQADACTSGLCGGSAVVCNDSNVCTTDSCDPATGCAFVAEPPGTPCNDGALCTTGDACQAGLCAGTPVGCDDSNTCTTDACDPGTGACLHTNVANGTTCSDGTACTIGDVCSGGACTGTPLTCNDLQSCTTDTCDPMAGCVFTALPNGTSCNDGNPCTTPDTCAAGVCSGPGLTCDDGNPCTADTCMGMSCTHTSVANGTACNDGSACTTGDQCQSGVCAGAAVGCNDGNPCTADSCDAMTGCQHAAVADGTSCNDADACTSSDACTGGVCGGSAVSCSDGNPCTADSCSAATGCANVPEPNGTACDDGNGCTLLDGCQLGACTGTPKSCTDNNVCTTDSCTPATGACVNDPVLASTPCNDGSACTTADQCGGGACAGTPLVCNDQQSCTTDSCNPALGCVFTPLGDGATCTDGNSCTTPDTCTAGVCSGPGLNCDDGNPCTADSCAGMTCTHTPLTDGTPCTDGDVCTSTDRCTSGVCRGAPVACDDGNVCTSDTCNPSTGCTSAPLNGTSCDDGNACTGPDLCRAGVCFGGPVSCDDSNACTVDACSPQTGCTHGPEAPGTGCNDGNACTQADVCQAGTCAGQPMNCNDNNSCTTDACSGGACQHVSVANGATCDDGNACTTQDNCASGACGGTAISCDDGQSCTTDTCNPVTGCGHAPLADGSTCSDGNGCTGPDVCAAGVCGGPSVTCDDANPCTADACANGSCTHTAVANGTTCDDGNACTASDQCSAGVCGGTPKSCDDSNVCTTDACDQSGQCQHTAAPDGTSCNDGTACTSADACRMGTCAGTAVTCDDGDPCTTDTCDATLGCQASGSCGEDGGTTVMKPGNGCGCLAGGDGLAFVLALAALSLTRRRR